MCVGDWSSDVCSSDLEVKQLVIGHFSARYEDESVLLNEAAAIFPQTVLARENMCITINNYTDTRDYDPL